MKNLIIQTYTYNDIKRNSHRYTYKQFPDLEEASRKSVQWYAKKINADYELYTDEPKWYKNLPGAHWHRMILFERTDYDNVLYLDHDLLINPQIKENIFEAKGLGVKVAHKASIQRIGWQGFNCGVLKFRKEEILKMAPVIHRYYHKEKNQEALNWCYWEVMGKEPRYLDTKWNHTWQPDQQVINIKHWPGGLRSEYPTHAFFNYWSKQ